VFASPVLGKKGLMNLQDDRESAGIPGQTGVNKQESLDVPLRNKYNVSAL